MHEEGLKIRPNGVGSVRVLRLLAFLASGTSTYTKDAAVNTKNSTVDCTVDDDSVQIPRKNLQTSIFLLFLLEEIRRRVLFVAKSQRICVAFHDQLLQTFSYSKVCWFQMGSSVVSLI